MIQPADVLVVAVAASLRWPPRPVRRMTRREARRAVKIARDAWPRLREILFAEVRRVAA